MEYQKIINLLDATSNNVPRFITKKWVEVHDHSNKIYSTNKQIIFKTSILQSDLCDYSDAYIIVKETITVTDPDDGAYDKKLVFKNNAPFISCITIINNTLIDNAEDLDILMPMYNLVKIIQRHQEVYGVIIEMKKIVVQKGI